MQTRICVLYLCTVLLTVSKKIYGIVHMRNNRKSWCFWGGSPETELYPETCLISIMKWQMITAYCMKINNL